MEPISDTSTSARNTPSWFDEAKLGIFIHWSPAAVPAFAPRLLLDELPEDPHWVKAWRRTPFAEMYQNTAAIGGSPTQRHHASEYGDLTYDSFVEHFRDDLIPQWDPEPWAELFEHSGAKYIVFTTKTEDGFAFWPSAHRNPRKPEWQSERDVVGDLAAAVRDRGIRFGTYYCGGIDWTFGGIPITSGASLLAAMPQSGEYIAHANGHWLELIERYETSVLWNDYGYPDAADASGLLKSYVERVPDGVVNDRFDTGVLRAALDARAADPGRDKGSAYVSPVFSDFLTTEYSVEGPEDPRRKWEACRGLGTSFGYNHLETSADYLTPTEVIHLLVDIVARGGNLLLNVGPTATGEIPWAQAERLLLLGQWLRLNRDAIYGTRPWQRAAGTTDEGLPIRFTASENAVHAIVLGMPRTRDVDIDVRLDNDTEVTLTGRSAPLAWVPSEAGARVTLPDHPDETPALALRMSPPTAVHPFDET